MDRVDNKENEPQGKISTIISDLGAVLLFPKDKNYTGKLNPLRDKLAQNPDFKFLDHFELNEELLDYLGKLKESYDFYIITEGTIQNAPEIKGKLDEIFERIFSAKEMGSSKKDPESYKLIVEGLGKKVEEVLYVDDSESNLEAARKAGLKTVRYESNEQVMKEIEIAIN